MRDINKNFFSCNQKWDEMPNQGDNRWCEQCSQCVVDFRTMAVPEIESIHKKSESKVCGIYTKNQVIQLYPAAKKDSYLFSYNKKVAAALLTFFSLTVPANGQRGALILDNNKNLVCPIDTVKVKIKQKETPVTSDSITISGRVTDYSGETLIGASIFIKGSSIGTVSDFDGNYELAIPTDVFDTLTFMYSGYQPLSISLKEHQSIIDVSMTEGASLPTTYLLGFSVIAPPNYKPWHRGFWRQLFNRWR